MRRRFALGAEVIHHRGEAASKEFLPEAVDHRARGERIVARDEPAREVEAREAIRASGFRLLQKMRRCRLDDLSALILPVAAR